MALVRYLGFTVGDLALDGARDTPAHGRFVPLPEPFPVGTELEIDGVAHRVTRIEEGSASGCWVRAAAAAAAVPETLDAEHTIPSPPPAEMAAPDAVPVPVGEAAAADPVEATEAAEPAPSAEEAAPEPAPDEPRSGKRKRRRNKTVLGR